MTSPAADFAHRLRSALNARTPATIDEPEARRAAVAVVISLDANPSLLFVKREEREADPWSGHAAFPGGFRNSPGERPDETARRETEEETGLRLDPSELVSTLDDVYPRSVLLPKVVVTPCVYMIPSPRDVRAVGEIAQALWIPVAEVFDEVNRKPYQLVLPTGNRDFDSIHAGGLVIWGLTERILGQIVGLLRIR